ncbi:Protein CBR-SYM-4 [Caenorhabditis briggsae]|uniref:WD repeat-containing protein 44 n=1 Tax=Caenorhabditis briggsae TaxID=6238 RepID=A8XNQ2_CAEBR|nr:Protein CBR-SYM-4 [Caenorhabditis briggsae]CAP34141.2 Protein CBR-SYM-4 [Caenorhabditis briggsae]
MRRSSRAAPNDHEEEECKNVPSSSGFVFGRPQNHYSSTPQRPDKLQIAPPTTLKTTIRQPLMSSTPFSSSRPSSGIFQTPSMASSRVRSYPSSSTSISARDSSHRDRLISLRHRMNKEFGNRQLVGPPSQDYEHDETMSTVSDAPSLHSWHHKMIVKNETTVVKASDTLSSCAAPRSEISFENSPISPNSSGVNNTIVPMRVNIPYYDARNRSSTWTPTDSTCSGVSPSARIPPPIPARAPVSSPVLNSPIAGPSTSTVAPMPRCPPPLPPRTPSMKLPDPIAFVVENRIEEEKKKNGVTREVSVGSSKSSDQIVFSTPEGKISTPEGNYSTPDDKEVCKGHRKSNSFERAFTSAKVMKTSPLPSNDALLDENEEVAEDEKKTNVEAEDVIRQLTNDVESSQNFSSYQDVESTALETIPSASNSTASSPSSASEVGSKLGVHIPEAISEKPPCTSKSFAALESTNSLSPAKTVTNRNSRSMSNDELRTMKSDKLSSSVDPITLDVERRLSMKRSGQHEVDQHSLGSLDETTSNRTMSRTGIGSAASFARNSVRYASGMLRGAFNRVRTAAHPGSSTISRHGIGEETSEGEESDEPHHPSVVPSNIVRPRKSKKGPYDFEHLTVEQELNNEHTGAIWCIKFSICGKLMATAGQDSILRVWVVRSHLQYFSEMREKYAANTSTDTDPMNPVDNMEQFRPPSSMDSVVNSEATTASSSDENNGLFCGKPFAILKGHTADILDVSWSKNYFILSSGMDRTVKLWHLSRNECLCCFQHIDFVTCVAFLPKDDRYFLSGSLDGKLRMWHIPDKKVAVWNDTEKKYITAMTFVKSGKFAVVGTYDGKCIFYTADQLKYHTAVDVRSTRGKNARGHKVTGLTSHGDKLLVTSNDSRIRMYDIRDKALTCKFKGVQNDHSQIRAAFSPDGRHIICGSEDKFVYIWRASDTTVALSVRKDRNSWWERVRTHNAPVPVAVFAPRPQVFFNMLNKRDKHSKSDSIDFNMAQGQSDSLTSNGNMTIPGHVIVSADLTGVVKVMVNRPRLVKANPLDNKSTRSRSSTLMN